MAEEQHRGRSGTLYVVATPIGNLEDITYRAVKTLGEVDLIAAEDTRHSRKLLARFDIQTPLVSYHDHNEHKRQDEMLERLQSGGSIALISDAGTPCIADPGYRLVASCHAAGISVVPVPGPSALIAALSAAGAPTDRFGFEGYLPQRSKARQDIFRSLQKEQRTLVFYEAPHRLAASLSDMATIMGDERKIVVARELTKLHEEFFRGTVADAISRFAESRVKGEIVLIVPPSANEPKMNMRDALQQLLHDGELSRREAVKLVAKEYGVSGSDVYRESLRLDEEEARDGEE